MSKYVSWKTPESEDCNTNLSDKFKDLESSDVLIFCTKPQLSYKTEFQKLKGSSRSSFHPVNSPIW